MALHAVGDSPVYRFNPLTKLFFAVAVTVSAFALTVFLVQGSFYPDARRVLLELGPLRLKHEGVLSATQTVVSSTRWKRPSGANSAKR
ncbi:hypothetical protein ACFOSC_00320 [Streptantibioticus rubrisoli]|uniref:Uncharacterized protein n=1 Tax=Streptantibioticus rubrisoli TaxID=1387313 RepID=A0ABT1PIF5_9ACTN|nr:hypothetical protein [Streptantibioticus rubrisoli]MCQ4045141.1 hypothetical protein [Streptantibioticus rubrisoli]